MRLKSNAIVSKELQNPHDYPMHVALILPSLSGGGAERNVLRLAAGLVKNSHSVDLLLLENIIAYPKEIPEHIRVFLFKEGNFRRRGLGGFEGFEPRISIEQSASFLTWLKLARILRSNPRIMPFRTLTLQTQFIANYELRYRPDFLLPFLPRAETSTLLASHLSENFPPVIPFIRNDMRHRHKKQLLRFQILQSGAAHFLAVSSGVATSVAESCGIPSAKITTVHHPIPVDEIQALSMNPVEHSWFGAKEYPIILAAGRLARQKDFPNLIYAFAGLRKKKLCRLMILGEGPRRRSLETLVKRLGLQDSVSLPGFVENPFALMRRASLFVVSSRFEGLSTVLLEALACGCPCVATNCRSGTAEILDRGRVGEVVPVGDEVALEEAMFRALSREPDRKLLRKRASEYGVNRAVERLEGILSEIGRNWTTKSIS